MASSCPHPLGVLPLGNSFAETAAPDIRSASLGPYFSALSDALLVSVLCFCDADALRSLALSSKALYAFARDDELWRALTLANFGVDFRFCASWRRTYVARAAAFAVPELGGDISTAESYLPHRNSKKWGQVVQITGLYSDVLFHKWRCQSAEVREAWLRFDNAPRIDAARVTCEQFRTEYEAPGVPVVITGLATEWPAFRKWDKGYLGRKFGDVSFTAGGYPFPMQKYMEFANAVEGRCDQPLYLFDKDFARKAPELAADYEVPSYFDDDLFQYLGGDSKRPAYRWLIVGPRNSGSSFHKDPNGTSAWNACIRGSKKWIFFPPDHPPPGVHPSSNEGDVTAPMSVLEWYMNYYDSAREAGSKVGAVECTVKAGEIVFVPSGWWHAVINLGWSAAVTQNYVSSVNFAQVAQWLTERPDQVSGCCNAAQAHEVARTFVSRVLEARPELRCMLSKRRKGSGGQISMPGSRVRPALVESDRRRLPSAGLWAALTVVSEQDKGAAIEKSSFSFGVG
jgi:hypothetical protein